MVFTKVTQRPKLIQNYSKFPDEEVNYGTYTLNRQRVSPSNNLSNQCVLSHSMALRALMPGILKLSDYITKLQTFTHLPRRLRD